MLELYHAEPASNSLKVLICLKEKGVPFVSHLMDIQAFEQHEPAFLKINPEGQVPALVHDGIVITESTVINEYLDQVFPDPPLRPQSALEAARMRVFTKYVDEYFRIALSQIGWQLMIHTITDKLSPDEFEARLARIPREEKREKWRVSAAQGYTPEQMAAWRRTLAEGNRQDGGRAGGGTLARRSALFARRHRDVCHGRPYAGALRRHHERDRFAPGDGLACADDGAAGRRRCAGDAYARSRVMRWRRSRRGTNLRNG